jgi:glycosyltransferase involved in cell wall biosynthesis
MIHAEVPTALSATLVDTPRVSVIIPVRNAKDFIDEALDSVLGQSFQDLEVILIDDGSDDFDYFLLCARDVRVRVIRLSGLGVSHARNAGMKLARGEFLAFLDADDVWFPGKLQAQIAYFDAHPNVGLVFGAFARWVADENGLFEKANSLTQDCSNLTEADPSRSGWLYTRLLMGLLVGMNTAIIRRDVYEAVGGFNESMRLGEDYNFWLKISRVTEMHALSGVLALYRIHGASAMHKLSPENHLAILLRSAFLRWGTANPDGTRISVSGLNARINATYFDHGYSHFWHGSASIAKAAFWHVTKTGGRRIRAVVYLLLTYLLLFRNALRTKKS